MNVQADGIGPAASPLGWIEDTEAGIPRSSNAAERTQTESAKQRDTAVDDFNDVVKCRVVRSSRDVRLVRVSTAEGYSLRMLDASAAKS